MIALHALLCAETPDDTPVCFDETTTMTRGMFRAHVAACIAAWSERAANRYALCIDDPFAFACALFALLASGKAVVIPASSAPAYLASIAQAYDSALTDGDMAGIIGQVAQPAGAAWLRPIAPHAPITLYTSGSSGAPKAIHKTLAQFDAEVRTLEDHWGEWIGPGAILASVPHHHIYGLLFRIFWPLASGRAFGRRTYAEPQALQTALTRREAAAVVSSPAQLARWPSLPGFDTLSPLPVAVFSSGGPLDEAAAATFASAHGTAPTEIYGSTETGGIAWRRRSESDAWQAFANVAVRREADGALSVRSPHLGHPDWHRTDDAVEFDDAGRFRLRGRMDRIVKLDGKRVSLPEIESWLGLHPYVAQSAAVLLPGASRERLGVLSALTPAGVEALRQHGRIGLAKTLRRHLATYVAPTLIPRKWRFRMRLPVDARGKLPAAAVAASFAAGRKGFEVLSHVRDAEGDHYELRVPPELVHFRGHFPGLPILPGVVLVDWIACLAAELVDATRSIRSIDQLKFMAPVPPAALVSLQLTHEPQRCRVRFRARLGTRECASGALVYREAD
ncbi:AMP-binding protein [Ralstonia pseudosolanacearum]|uniref:AMP-binding protein n=1 Tax=Ralstonia solanacearum TaxID=305 RepID=A0AA92QD70_RALSL|nr:AMP-binding protein [Ralstonia pseudosolanacearum]QOK98806.1 AMP-binding protein [Ralstonia pseudosolanacearum]UWD88249.1 AMP-binding protein [Ralstonia pseudosolanacearum]CAH0439922.1 D-alanine--D-alanyl carrier protein ligase [Ralstonia pseudosolanacearum]